MASNLSLDGWKTVSDIVSTWVGLVGLIVGGVFALYEYRAHVEEARVEKTIDFYKLWSGDTLDKAYFAFASGLADPGVANGWDQLENAHYNDRNALDPDQPLGGFVVGVITAKHLEESMDRMNNFFDALDQCIVSEACDSRLGTQLFCHIVKPYEQSIRPFITAQRKYDQTYAQGTDRFAHLCAAPQPAL